MNRKNDDLTATEKAIAGVAGCLFALVLIGGFGLGLAFVTKWFMRTVFHFDQPWWIWWIAWWFIGLIGKAFKGGEDA